MLACRNNMPEEALMILASSESRPDFVRPDGTALTLACKNSMSKVAMKILSLTKHLPAKTWDEYYYTMAIRNAIKKSLYEVALAILDIGRINVDHVSEGKTLLDEAIATIGDNDEQMSLIVRLFSLISHKRSILGFMFAVKGGIDFLLNNSASSLDALMSVQSRKEFIDSQTCQICGVFDPTSGYRHSCDVFFHKKCLLSWTHHALGEILNFKHSECPACQQMLQVDVPISTAILGKIFVLREKIQSLDPKKYWKACKS